jgi:hypothetical protein
MSAGLEELIPAGVERVRRELVLARFIGKLVVDHGIDQLRQRVADATAGAPAPHQLATQEGAADAPIQPATEPSLADAAPSDGHHGAVVADLALPDYDDLPAVHIVAKLAGLTLQERDQIEAFERSHRNRQTVLGKIDQLRSEASP